MSYIPINSAKNPRSAVCRRFAGLNRKDYASFGEFSDMKNMSSECYPFLSPAAEKSTADKFNMLSDGSTAQNIRAVIAPPEDSSVTGFCGVIGTTFYYDGSEKPLYQPEVKDDSGNHLYGMIIPTDGVIQLLWVNKVILIHGYDSAQVDPFIYYYDTADTSDDCVKSYEYTHRGWYGEQITGTAGKIKIIFSIDRPENFKGHFYDFKVGESLFIDGIMDYSDSRWGAKSALDIISATVTGYTEALGSGSYGIRTWNVTIELDGLNYKGEIANRDFYATNVYRIYRKIPYMTHLTLHKGRLWGASPNGEFVYASALNDVFNFNLYDGLEDDSVYLESSTEGGHKGVISCGNCVAVLKKNSFDAIYGELPSEFSVGKSYSGIGCIDINSAVVINNALFFLGSRGFYEWTGSRPVLISEKLGKKYVSAYGFTDGLKYYVSAYDGREYENLAYDIKYMTWHRNGTDCYTGGFLKDGKNYAVSGGNLYLLGANAEKSEWMAESAKIFCEDFDMDRIGEMWIYLKAEENGEIEVMSSADGEQMTSCLRVSLKKTGGRCIRVPIRMKEGMYWQYRIKGKGKIIIFGIKIIYESGGRVYKNERSNEL